jgi:hypothetical protein
METLTLNNNKYNKLSTMKRKFLRAWQLIIFQPYSNSMISGILFKKKSGNSQPKKSRNRKFPTSKVCKANLI